MTRQLPNKAARCADDPGGDLPDRVDEVYGPLQVRRYGKLALAEVRVSGSTTLALRTGTQLLNKYFREEQIARVALPLFAEILPTSPLLLLSADPCSKMSMPLVAALMVSGGQLQRVYYLSTTLATIDALVALLGPETLPLSERKPFKPKVSVIMQAPTRQYCGRCNAKCYHAATFTPSSATSQG